MERLGNRDIVVVGTSLGGVEALPELVGGLPHDLPAAVLIVQHAAEEGPGLLAEILSRRGPLPAVMAEDGMELRCGSIVVAPPGRHLLLTGRGIRVAFGPRENLCRPAIDPLFRTAAVNYGSRVIGVVLTGLLNDGAAGLLAVSRCGGLPLVQDPADAGYPDMPRHALEVVPDARAVSLRELGRLLGVLTREAAPPSPPVPDTLLIEAEMTERAMSNDDWNRIPGHPTSFTCPECNGALQQMEDAGITRYRCRVGHAYSLEALVAAKDQAVEDALWLAMQTLQERAQMLESLGRHGSEQDRTRVVQGFQKRAREARESADRLRQLLLDLREAAA